MLSRALDERIQAVYFETPCNPTLELIDLAATRRVVDAADKKDALPLRIRRQQQTALAIAKWLEKHPNVGRGFYPGLASMTRAAVDAETRARGHIDPGGIRTSLGLEEPQDLMADLSAALATV